ncbi:MAG: hypothetical protein B6D63_04475 [Candidatus Latescibacteria bacterium 4484_7]|nr:MAG: hypothetical protein B6D63_04475 [Candidatus Latescibacteria bacterium 4484_7]RKZ08436.1 MAG: hypothetical protein DRQ05_01495 [bacterium]
MSGKGGYSPVVFYIFVVIGAFLLGILIFNTLIVPSLVGRRDVVIVPDLKNLSINEAKEKCREYKLNVVVVGHRYSDEVPADYIIEQDPEPQEGLKKGRAIKVIVSSGVEMEVVPDLRNSSLRKAEIVLKSVGLKKGRVVNVFTHEKITNVVIGTSPPHGARVSRGHPVDLLVLIGGKPREYIMPNLVGMDLPFAKDWLSKKGFQISRVITKIRNDKFPNTILDQNPKPGGMIEEGGSIELVVSAVE